MWISQLMKWIKGSEETGSLMTNPESKSYKYYESGSDCHCSKPIKPATSIYICECQTLCHYQCLFQELQVMTRGNKKVIQCPACNKQLKLKYKVKRTQKIQCRVKYALFLMLAVLIFSISLAFLVYTVMSLENTINPIKMKDAVSITFSLLGIGLGYLLGHYSVLRIIYVYQDILQSIIAVQKPITGFDVTFNEASNSITSVIKNSREDHEVQRVIDRIPIIP